MIGQQYLKYRSTEVAQLASCPTLYNRSRFKSPDGGTVGVIAAPQTEFTKIFLKNAVTL